MDDQDLLCIVYMPSLVTLAPMVFVSECRHTHTHKYRADKRPAPATTSPCVKDAKKNIKTRAAAQKNRFLDAS